jgi:predicted PurR-regulated permease PerM
LSPRKLFDFSSKSAKQRLILIILWLLIAIGLYSVRTVLMPFALALLLAYVFHPVVGFLGNIKIRSKPLPRFVSVLFIYFVLLLALGLLATFFVPQFYKEMLRLAKEASVFFNTLDESSVVEFSKTLESFFRR